MVDVLRTSCPGHEGNASIIDGAGANAGRIVRMSDTHSRSSGTDGERERRGKKKKIEKGGDKKERKKRETIVVMYWFAKTDNYDDGNVT